MEGWPTQSHQATLKGIRVIKRRGAQLPDREKQHVHIADSDLCVIGWKV